MGLEAGFCPQAVIGFQSLYVNRESRIAFWTRALKDYLESLLRGEGEGGGGGLPTNRLMGMCRWMGSRFHDWIDYNVPWVPEVLSRHAFVRCRRRSKADRPAGGRQQAA